MTNSSIPGLREHLLAAGAGQPAPPPPLTPQHGHPGGPHAIDPAIAGPQYPMSQGETGDGHMSEGRKGRRELSTSKRAAQNRAAQVRLVVHNVIWHHLLI